MISINAKISGVTFDVKVDDNVNILTGYSGTGKTFMFIAITEYARNIGTVIISMKLAFNLKLKPYSVYKISYTDDKVVLINKSKDVAVRC